MRTAFYTLFALSAFAANSILCRMALGRRLIDAVTFTCLRLVSGALMLTLLIWAFRAGRPKVSGNWGSALALFAYAAPFSFAYLRLPAGVGALVLFGAVQATMIGWDILRGRRPDRAEWAGLVLSLGGLFALTLPGAAAPDPYGLFLMTIAGIAWGAYSLRGRGAGDPLAATTGNFVRSVAPALVLGLGAFGLGAFPPFTGLTAGGALYAIASGALASGVGYAAWYEALKGLSATRAAILQLLVPVLAAAAGVALLDETVSTRLVASAAAILGGVALAILRPARRPDRKAKS